jgi:hypothetical protein
MFVSIRLNRSARRCSAVGSSGNAGVKGRIIFAESSTGLKNLTVCAFDVDPCSARAVTAQDLLGNLGECCSGAPRAISD